MLVSGSRDFTRSSMVRLCLINSASPPYDYLAASIREADYGVQYQSSSELQKASASEDG